MAKISPQSLGGEARKKALSKSKRSEIAKKAAVARWAPDLPKASLEGEIPLGDGVIACAIVGEDTRVITQATFLRSLGRARSPKAGTGVLSTMDELPFFLSAEAFKPFISDELIESTKPIFYVTKSGGRGVGYDAKLLPEAAEVYLKFRDYHLVNGGEIPARYEKMVAAADIVMRGLAKVGIVALVDEATGFQDIRAKDALAKIFEQFLSEERQKWTQTFPLEFYREIYRLRGWDWQPWNTRRPQVVALWTNDFVYDRLAPDLTDELKRLNPTTKPGQRAAKHTQWFNEDRGHPKLKEHISGVSALLRAADRWESFKTAMDRAYPKFGNTIELPLTGGKGRKSST